MSKSETSSPKELLLSTALRLFCIRGYHTTGIDLILAESGVAKKTLYRHFPSKDDLIVAVLTRRDELWRDWFKAAIKSRATTPISRLLAAFDALEEWFARPDFHGCMFINAAAEFPSPSHPVHIEAARHKKLVREFLYDLAVDARLPNPHAIAESFSILMEGAIVVAQVEGIPSASRAKAAAFDILQSTLPPASRSTGQSHIA